MPLLVLLVVLLHYLRNFSDFREMVGEEEERYLGQQSASHDMVVESVADLVGLGIRCEKEESLAEGRTRYEKEEDLMERCIRYEKVVDLKEEYIRLPVQQMDCSMRRLE